MLTPADQNGAARARSAPLWPGLLLALVTFALLVVYWALYIHRQFFPVGDEFSLVVHSTRFFHPNLAEWFRQGFSGYFEPYPDLSLPYSNFLRPVANLTYFIQSLLFGRHWSLYLLGNYAIVAATVFTVWHLARRELALPLGIATLVSLGVAVSPAVSYQAVLRPSFAFDLLGALWALLALATLLRRQWTLAGLCVLLAVLTKETAYYTPLAAAATAFVLLPRLAPAPRFFRSLGYLVPLLLVAALRKLDFPGHGSGVYVLNQSGQESAVKRVILAFTHWPYLLPGEQHIFERSLHNVTALLITAACWGLLLLFARERLPRRDTSAEAIRSPLPVPATQARFAVLLFLAASLLLPIGLDLGPRFGASVYPLLFLALGCMVVDTPTQAAHVVALGLLLALPVVDAVALTISLSGPSLHREQRLWARSRNMVQLLSQETQPVVFLVADASESFSSPVNVQRFAGYRGTLVPVSNLDTTNCPQGALQVTHVSPGTYHVRALAPGPCGGNTMGATYHLTTRRVSRFTRDLPTATMVYDAHDGGWSDGQFSAKELEIQLTPRVPSYAIVVPRSESSLDFLAFTPVVPGSDPGR